MPLIDVPGLLAALSDDAPCGPDLQYAPEYVELQQWMRGTPDVEYGSMHQAAADPDWRAVKTRALSLLERSRDLRLAIHLCHAMVALHGYAGLDEGIALIEGLLRTHWDGLHPQLDAEDGNDPTERINALLALEDKEGLWRTLYVYPLVRPAGHPGYGVRDVDIATGDLTVADGEPAGIAEIEAAFSSAPLDELEALHACLVRVNERVDAMGALLVQLAGYGHVVSLVALSGLLKRALRAVQNGIATHPARVAVLACGDDACEEGKPASSARDPASLSSRDDVARMLDRICEYYATHEPASPVPLLLQRARRLVGLDFVSIVTDLSPQSLPEIHHLAGTRHNE
ncbi:hypothetical protein CAL14_03885 [Bordetella genomosp. 9]|uniref:type VI secretion system protein TssA n=1 Tax=Bordetella genomosp. 9 TaxID=1416803 RepID=UPI000A2915E7|nr:type VI secretion system protein TssA [Bordetella genomosp. 9]ARP89535.1 hypothetical protein CAL14_03885 [Bordetella genomosp. 9]